MAIEKESVRKQYYQYFVAIIASLIAFGSAVGVGWPSPTIPKLMTKDSPIFVTSSESGWIVAFATFGGIFSPLPAVYIMDKCGRKVAILLCAIPLIIGWFLIALANTISVLLTARLFIGFAFSWSFSILPIYLAEIASSNIRGAICNINTIMNNLGILFAYLVCPLVSIKTFPWITLAAPIFGVTIFIWLPESPYYLVQKNEIADAYRCLAELRQIKDVQEEFNEILTAVEQQSVDEKKSNKIQDMLAPDTRRSLILIIALSAIGQLSGWIAIIAYAQTIFKNIDESLGEWACIILGIIQLLANLFSSVALDKWGRRPLLLTSLSIVGICHTMLAIYFSTEQRYQYDLTKLSWIPVVVIFIYNVASNIGLGTVPMVILGEIFPSNLKATATIIFTMVATFLCLCVGKLFQVITDNYGNDVPFWLFAGFCFSFWPYLWYALPETKGKSLNEILNKINLR